MQETIEIYWQGFLEAKGLPQDLRYNSCFHFELTEKLANKLLDLVLKGIKKATSSSLVGYEIEGEPVPKEGEYHIITDWEGHPRCVIETVKVTILPFKEITYDICKREGEDDTLESWQRGHIRFFEAEGKELGYTFTENMPVIFEDFEVIYR